MFYTYAHYTPENRLFYIGKGGSTSRAHYFKHRNDYWNNVVAKHGKPKVEILAKWQTESEAFDHEKLLISCFKDIVVELCNLTGGGEGQLGMEPWNKGVPWSEEARLKMGANRKGIVPWNKGIPTPIETRLKNSNSKKGKPSWNKGKKHTEEHKRKTGLAKVNNTNCLQYTCVGVNVSTGEIVSFVGAKALRAAGFAHTAVYCCINGTRKSHKGYTWSKEPLENK